MRSRVYHSARSADYLKNPFYSPVYTHTPVYLHIRTHTRVCMVASRAIAPSWLPTVFHTRARREERSRTGPLRPTDCDCTTALSTRELSRIYKRRGKRIAFPSSRGESDKYRVTFCVILTLSLSLSLALVRNSIITRRVIDGLSFPLRTRVLYAQYLPIYGSCISSTRDGRKRIDARVFQYDFFLKA